MEVLSAMLTALFLWLLLAHGAVARKAFQREQAGGLLLRIRLRISTLSRTVRLLGSLSLGAIMAVMAWHEYQRGDIGSAASSSFWTLVVLLFLVSFSELDCGIELRDQGLVRSDLIKVAFLGWSEIRYCQWRARGKVLRVQRFLFRDQYRVPADQRDAVTEVLAQHVQVLDEEGNPIGPEKRSAAGSDRPDGAVPKPRFHWHQFSLRTLLLAVVVAGAASSWYAQRKHRLDRWRTVAEKLPRLGALYVDPSGPGTFLSFDSSGPMPSDDDLALLDEFPRLKFLSLMAAPITDGGLAHVAPHKTLISLGLSRTRITDAGMVHLEGLNNLETLYLSFTPLTDASVESLAKLKRLNKLDVKGTKISPEGIRRLREALRKTEITPP